MIFGFFDLRGKMNLATARRKIRRMRGSRTHGWGQVGQHRKSGSRGGTGLAGLHKHKWTWTVKYDPNHFGHDAFKPPKRIEIKTWANVGHLDEIYQRLRPELTAKGDLPVLDLGRIGYQKLLGGGLVRGAYKVIVPRFTSEAREKVQKAGGQIVVG